VIERDDAISGGCFLAEYTANVENFFLGFGGVRTDECRFAGHIAGDMHGIGVV